VRSGVVVGHGVGVDPDREPRLRRAILTGRERAVSVGIQISRFDGRYKTASKATL